MKPWRMPWKWSALALLLQMAPLVRAQSPSSVVLHGKVSFR
jgi:hypothetical protein